MILLKKLHKIFCHKKLNKDQYHLPFMEYLLCVRGCCVKHLITTVTFSLHNNPEM